MSPDWSKPSGYARWGWVWAVLAGSGGIPNLWSVVFGEGFTTARAIGLLISAAGVALCLWIWRKGVRDDREHRAYMTAWARKWGVQ